MDRRGERQGPTVQTSLNLALNVALVNTSSTQVSVKERFTITPDEVPDLLNGKFPRLKKIEEMRAKGRPEKEIADWDLLVTEICQAINSKQLIPTMRSQASYTLWFRILYSYLQF